MDTSYSRCPANGGMVILPLSVSCSTTTFCMAVGSSFGGNNGAFIYNGTNWSSSAIGSGLISVSCPTTTFCLASGSGDQYVAYTGTGWSAPQSLVGAEISCSSVTFCMAAVDDGSEATFNGSYWSYPKRIDPATPQTVDIESVSCATSTFCVAVDNGGNAFTWS
jgi:hypothetical protein